MQFLVSRVLTGLAHAVCAAASSSFGVHDLTLESWPCQQAGSDPHPRSFAHVVLRWLDHWK